MLTLTSFSCKLKSEKKRALNKIVSKDKMIQQHLKKNNDLKDQLQKVKEAICTGKTSQEAIIKLKDEKNENQIKISFSLYM